MTKPPVKKLDQSDYHKTNLRLPPELHSKLVAEAERNGRSMNAEILARLLADQSDAVLAELAELKMMVRKLLDNI